MLIVSFITTPLAHAHSTRPALPPACMLVPICRPRGAGKRTRRLSAGLSMFLIPPAPDYFCCKSPPFSRYLHDAFCVTEQAGLCAVPICLLDNVTCISGLFVLQGRLSAWVALWVPAVLYGTPSALPESLRQWIKHFELPTEPKLC